MARKKWTPKTEITDRLLKFREKRKWQIALRRYVLEKQKCYEYAPFFGLDIASFRKWIEVQFDASTTWENFSKAWQFDHVVPLNYFDFNNPDDLHLCWNFINIRVGSLAGEKSGSKVDVLSAKAHFQELYNKTEYPLCLRMIQKIEQVEAQQPASHANLEQFIIEHKGYLDSIASFSSYEYDKLNAGEPIEAIQKEQNFLRRFQQKLPED